MVHVVLLEVVEINVLIKVVDVQAEIVLMAVVHVKIAQATQVVVVLMEVVPKKIAQADQLAVVLTQVIHAMIAQAIQHLLIAVQAVHAQRMAVHLDIAVLQVVTALIMAEADQVAVLAAVVKNTVPAQAVHHATAKNAQHGRIFQNK